MPAAPGLIRLSPPLKTPTRHDKILAACLRWDGSLYTTHRSKARLRFQSVQHTFKNDMSLIFSQLIKGVMIFDFRNFNFTSYYDYKIDY